MLNGCHVRNTLPKRRRWRRSRKESRGGHTRDDFPSTDAKFAKINIMVRKQGDGMTLSQEPLPEMPDELKALLEEKN